MLDKDLAELYGVETRTLNQAVKRNSKRFPKDFMFILSETEWKTLRSLIVILEGKGKHVKYLPFAFTQNGIAMLSSVLSSDRAIEVNIQIMRIFTRSSELLRQQAAIYNKITVIEKQGQKNSADIETIFSAIEGANGLSGQKSRKKIGFD